MPISNGICQYVWKDAVLNKNICHFWDRHRARFTRKNPKHRNIYKWCNAALWIFFRETRSVTVPRFGFFFQNSRIRVKTFIFSLTRIQWRLSIHLVLVWIKKSLVFCGTMNWLNRWFISRVIHQMTMHKEILSIYVEIHQILCLENHIGSFQMPFITVKFYR